MISVPGELIALIFSFHKHILRLVCTTRYTLAIPRVHYANEDTLCKNYFLPVGITSGIPYYVMKFLELLDDEYHGSSCDASMD